jgi:peptidoglycan/xylan/chitin deacetylase (PgdA/CDA1 family)
MTATAAHAAPHHACAPRLVQTAIGQIGTTSHSGRDSATVAGTDSRDAMAVTSFMYHAVHAPGYKPVAWDPHYAVSADALRRQLQQLLTAGFGLRSVLDTLAAPPVGRTACITFDDGGSTDADVAMPILLACGARADFFVSAGRVGTRGFVSWTQLRDMATAGMSIQSHGHDHRLLDDQNAAEVEHELRASKAEIEDRLGRPVTLFAPPGGRLTAQVVRTARQLGYHAICSSRPGRWRPGSAFVLPRFAVLCSTPDARLLAWANGGALRTAPSMARYAVAWIAKKALGNDRYQRLRSAALDESGSRPEQ